MARKKGMGSTGTGRIATAVPRSRVHDRVVTGFDPGPPAWHAHQRRKRRARQDDTLFALSQARCATGPQARRRGVRSPVDADGASSDQRTPG